jgi:hypothetical protein
MWYIPYREIYNIPHRENKVYIYFIPKMWYMLCHIQNVKYTPKKCMHGSPIKESPKKGGTYSIEERWYILYPK